MSPAPLQVVSVSATPVADLIPVSEWPFPWPTEATWRHLIARAESNGLAAAGAILRVGVNGPGTRIVIDRPKFEEWVRRQGPGKPMTKPAVAERHRNAKGQGEPSRRPSPSRARPLPTRMEGE